MSIQSVCKIPDAGRIGSADSSMIVLILKVKKFQCDVSHVNQFDIIVLPFWHQFLIL